MYWEKNVHIYRTSQVIFFNSPLYLQSVPVHSENVLMYDFQKRGTGTTNITLNMSEVTLHWLSYRRWRQ
jgi:hypothetical protein